VNIDGGDEIGVGKEGLKRGLDITKLSQKKTKVRRTGTLLFLVLVLVIVLIIVR